MTFRVPTSRTFAFNMKQESNSLCFEQFVSSSFLLFSFETYSGSNLKHFFGDERVIDVGGILRVLDFGRLGVGTG